MKKIQELRTKMELAGISKELMSEITTYILNIEEDLNYHQSILDGSWPTSRRIMLESLLKMEKESL